jgi:hypothetical protein
MATFSPTAKKIIATLARLCQLHDNVDYDATRHDVAAFSNLRMNSTFRNACAMLKRMDLIECSPSTSIRINSQGMQVAHNLTGGTAAKLTNSNEAIQHEIKTNLLQKNKRLCSCLN